MSNQLTILFRDNLGKVARMGILVAAAVIDPTGGAVGTFRAAIAAITKCLNYQASLTFYAAYADTAVAGSFTDNEDKAQMVFTDAAGEAHAFKIPAPLESLFLSDKSTIDAAAGPVASYVTWMLANAKTKNGLALVSFRGGRRIRKDRKGK